MFAARYFPSRMFAGRYFPKIGAEAPPMDTSFSLSGIARAVSRVITSASSRGTYKAKDRD